VDVLPAKCLAELANNFVDSVKTGEIRNGKAFVLFPKILSSIGTKATVCYGNNDMTGADYSSHILNILCSAKWHPDCVTHLAAMFRDVPLTNEELQFVIDKILRMFKSMDLQELPPLIYQLLLLSTKGHKRLVLEGVSTFFCQQDNICRAQNHSEYSEEVSSVSQDQLRHIEGTVILHVTFAVKQDQELGREFIKYLKAGQQGSSAKIVTAFNMALALSVARIHRFEEPVFDFLKTAILKSYKDEDKKKSSKWIEESIPSSQHKTPNQKACDLGAKVLLNTFKAHDVVRSEILEQILNRVVTKATTPVSHYIELFSSTVKSAPQILLESLSVVREAIDYLAYLPTTSAEGLLKAVQPLMKISITLKDSLILILRKAMFSRLLMGLYDVLTRNPQLKCAILEMLLSQLKAYYEAGTDVNPPIVLAPCITAQGDSVYLVEPI
ncbi:Fanconi anemia group I protein-like, partial [Saccoglossus kowalevskii]